MNIIKMAEVEGKKNKRGVIAKQLIKHDNAQVMNLVLEPGNIVPEHSVPVDVFFYIVKGRGTLKIGDEKAIVEATDIITCPPNTKMSLNADQGEEFVVLNVKTPSL
ncbi:MAG: cupin domain-containing protein [Halanaerobiales bacterium]